MNHKRPTFSSFKKNALDNPKVKSAYDELSASFNMKRQMIAMRQASGMTQEDMADLLGTKKSNISRLESLNSETSPKLATIEDYARVLGYSVRVEFEPRAER